MGTTTRGRKVAALTAGIAALALTLAGCAGGSEAGAPSGELDPDAPLDLRMTVWTADEQQLALFQEIADGYIEAHPERVASVSFEPIGFDDYIQTLTTQLAGNNTPDLGWVLESYAPEFVESGALVPLNETLENSEGYEFDDLLPSSLALWEKDSELYAYPFSNSPFAVFVNTDMLAAANQPMPADLVESGEWTFDNAREIAAATAQQSGKQGLVVRDFEYRVWEFLATVWGGWGASPWSEDGSQAQFSSPQMVEALQWVHDAAFVDGAMPTPGQTADFFAGESAMTITQISRASALDGSFEWDLVPLPAGPEGKQNVIGQAGVGVFANGQNPAVAADFLAYFTNPENAAKLATYFPPPRESLLNAEVLATANPKLTKEQLQAVVIEGIEGAVTKPSHKNFARLQEQVRIQLDALWQPDADVQGVLESTDEAIQPLLEG
ncbi:sugar ABC transporter substrate-binding protein [Microbacterium sp. W1N]|uniref:ABC transporter substrate-binding protein n=1 Tax=Microbacterium festucae TaxID=2977531 RepID=UPI0021C1F173|nr:sugar ABC transporter substrate-binding protein [Microbacterium festucae]MCT9820802.1 sugar ABC transporter substrate-binding protein [Microbacterium festucae]